MVRRTKEEAQETRNLILDTAERVFYEKGVSRTTLGDIAAAAGVTRGAIYWHFKNKAELVNEMLERATLPMEGMIEAQALARADDPLGAIRFHSLLFLQRAATDQQCRRVFDIVTHKCEYVDDIATLRQRRQECRSECLQEIEEGFRAAVRKGQLPKSLDPRITALGLFSLVDGLLANWLLDPEAFSLEKDAAPVIDQYLSGLAAASGRTSKK